MTLLQRTGKPPLHVTGESIATASTERDGARQHFELELFELRDGRYVVALSYLTTVRSDEEWHGAYVIPRRENIPEAIDGAFEVAMERFEAQWPRGPQFDEKRRQVGAMLRQRFGNAVSELLAEEAFAEEP